jgi:hypothetical protein
MSDESAEAAAAKYDPAERAYLLAVRDGVSDRQLLGALASTVRDAASAWESAAWKEFFSARDRGTVTGQDLIEMEILAEKGEVIAELWEDIVQAHAGRYQAPVNRG